MVITCNFMLYYHIIILSYYHIINLKYMILKINNIITMILYYHLNNFDKPECGHNVN